MRNFDNHIKILIVVAATIGITIVLEIFPRSSDPAGSKIPEHGHIASLPPEATSSNKKSSDENTKKQQETQVNSKRVGRISKSHDDYYVLALDAMNSSDPKLIYQAMVGLRECAGLENEDLSSLETKAYAFSNNQSRRVAAAKEVIQHCRGFAMQPQLPFSQDLLDKRLLNIRPELAQGRRMARRIGTTEQTAKEEMALFCSFLTRSIIERDAAMFEALQMGVSRLLSKKLQSRNQTSETDPVGKKGLYIMNHLICSVSESCTTPNTIKLMLCASGGACDPGEPGWEVVSPSASEQQINSEAKAFAQELKARLSQGECSELIS